VNVKNVTGNKYTYLIHGTEMLNILWTVHRDIFA